MTIEKHIRHSQKPHEERGPASEKNVRWHQERTKKKIDKIFPERNGEIEETRTERKERIEFLLSEETTWADAVHECLNADDFRLLFRTYGMGGDEWQNSKVMRKRGFGRLYKAISEDARFTNWTDFLRFMGFDKEDALTQKVHKCKSPQAFLLLFQSLGIQSTEWRAPAWLRASKLERLYRAIIGDARFLSWNAFLQYMGDKVGVEDNFARKGAMTRRIRLCKTPHQFRNFFRSLHIPKEIWQSSNRLRKNGYLKISSVISKDPRFPTWRDFRKFMGIKEKPTLSDRIKKCENREDFLKLFKSLGLKKDEWQKTNRLQSCGLQQVTRCILRRFHSWKKFLSFMGIEKDEYLIDQVRNCKIPAHFLQIFRSADIKGDYWKNTNWLIMNNHHDLYSAIYYDTRFPSWSVFLAFMDGRLPAKPIESPEQARRLIEKEIRRLRSEVKWITKLPKQAPIAPQEIETMLSDAYYKKNGVARAVADFYRAQEENSQQ